LRVKGDSMIDEHICDGDIALIENRTDARDGEIVVALLIEENQATLKRLYRRGMNVELQPANSQLQPLTVPANQVRVQGIFRGLLRPSTYSCKIRKILQILSPFLTGFTRLHRIYKLQNPRKGAFSER